MDKGGMPPRASGSSPQLLLPPELSCGEALGSLAEHWRQRATVDRRYMSAKRHSAFSSIGDILNALPLGPNALAKIGTWPEAMLIATIQKAVTCEDPVEAMRMITRLDGFSPTTSSHILYAFSKHAFLVMNEATLFVVDKRKVASIKGARFWESFSDFSASSCRNLGVDIVTLQHAIWERAASQRPNYAKT
jgi:hypothetical protein